MMKEEETNKEGMLASLQAAADARKYNGGTVASTMVLHTEILQTKKEAICNTSHVRATSGRFVKTNARGVDGFLHKSKTVRIRLEPKFMYLKRNHRESSGGPVVLTSPPGV